MPWPLYISYPFGPTLLTILSLVNIINIIGFFAPPNYMLIHLMGKYQIKSKYVLALTNFIIWEYLLAKKGYLAMNICSHLHNNPCMILVDVPKYPKYILSPSGKLHPLSQGWLIIGLKQSNFRYSSVSSVRTVWGGGFISSCYLLYDFL